MVAPLHTLPECPSCNGWGTADGQPAGTPERDAWAERNPCRRCDGTGNAPLSMVETQKLIRAAHDLSSLAGRLGVAIEVSTHPKPRIIFRTSGRHPDLTGALPDTFRIGPDLVTREHYEQGGAEITIERVVVVRGGA